MTSERKMEANRQNAKRSTGPKTEIGKARSSRNARQHGLSRLNREDDSSAIPDGSQNKAGFARELSSLDVDDLFLANVRLGRIRQARHEMLIALLESPSPQLAKRLAGLERYERPVRAAQRRALKRLLKRR